MGTRVLVPWLPFFAIAVAGVALPEWGDWSRARVTRIAAAVVFTALVVPSAGRMVLATAIRPEVNRVDDPFADYYLPLWRADKVAVNTVPFHSGNNDPKSAWNLGELMGLEGRASLWPLAAFAVSGAAWLAWTTRRRAAPSDRPLPAVD